MGGFIFSIALIAMITFIEIKWEMISVRVFDFDKSYLFVMIPFLPKIDTVKVEDYSQQ